MPPIKRSSRPAPNAANSPRRVVAGRSTRGDSASGNPAELRTEKKRSKDTKVRPKNRQRFRDLTPRQSRILRILAVLALVVGVVAGGVGIWQYTTKDDVISNRAYVDQARTEQVTTAAVSSVQRLVAIDYRKLDEYHNSLGEFLTPDLIAELDKSWPTLKDTYTQTKLVVDAKVSDVGISYLEKDRAEVLLVQDVSTTRDGAAAGSTTGTYLVTMSLIDGVWKLSKIPDLPS